MKISKATKKDIKQSLIIAKSLKKWFNKNGIKNMKIDFEVNNTLVALEKK